jgi:hypothetical protein
MIRLQSEAVEVRQVIVASVEGEWVVAAIGQNEKFYRLSYEEQLRVEQALEVVEMAKGAMMAGFADVDSLKDWVNEQVSGILHPDM